MLLAFLGLVASLVDTALMARNPEPFVISITVVLRFLLHGRRTAIYVIYRKIVKYADHTGRQSGCTYEFVCRVLSDPGVPLPFIS